MNLLITLITASFISFNTIALNSKIVVKGPNIIDAFKLAYDAMYKQPGNFEVDYIILDMESYDFTNTTQEERQETIKYFSKYDKTVLNASLFKLQEIGLADELGKLKINGEILMITCVKPEIEKGVIIIESQNYRSPTAINFYTINLEVENNKWILKSITLSGVS